MSSRLLSFVLPVSRHSRDGADLERMRILLTSFLQFFDLDDLGRFFVVVPREEAGLVRDIVKELCADERFLVVSELDICPELANARDLGGWEKQQLLKLAISERVETSHYVTLDADVICVRNFDASSLIVAGRALCGVETMGDYLTLYTHEFAIRERGLKQERVVRTQFVLETPRPSRYVGRFYSETPVLLETSVVRSLTAHIAEHGRKSWTEELIKSPGWTEYALYFQYLESAGLLEAVHFPSNRNAVLRLDRSLWHPPSCYPQKGDTKREDWDGALIEEWDAASAFQPHGDGFFVVLQSYLKVPAEKIWEKIKPYVPRPAEARSCSHG